MRRHDRELQCTSSGINQTCIAPVGPAINFVYIGKARRWHGASPPSKGIASDAGVAETTVKVHHRAPVGEQ